MYGSSRLGVKEPRRVLLQKEYTIAGFEESGEIIIDACPQHSWREVIDSFVYVPNNSYFYRMLAQKQYELSNHLGNVLATVLDRRIAVFDQSSGNLTHYQADIITATQFYPFGSILSSVSKGEYRYGMNTQEKDNEIYGEGNSYTAEYWQYDARLGRRWNVDPRPNPSISTYATFANNPLLYNDKYGDTVRSNNLSSYNETAMLPLTKSSVVSEFLKQFGAANGGEFTNSKSKYGNVINLNLNSVTQGTARRIMANNRQNATTDFSYNLSDGTSVAVELYTPREGLSVTGISININVLSGVFSNAESDGNNITTAAIRSSRAITTELFTSVTDFMSLLNENMNSDGEINYVGLSNSYRSGSATPNNTALPAALNSIANSVPNSSGLFYQYDIIDKGSGTVVDSPVISFRDVFLDTRTNFNIFSNSTLNTCSNSIPNRPSSGLASPATICNPTPREARNPN